MSLKNTFLTRNKIIGIIFHERSSLCILLTCCHKLHYAKKSCCLPVTLCTKAVALFHKVLNSKTWKLLKRTKISKVSNNCLIIMLNKELLNTDFLLSLNKYMLSEFLLISAIKDNLVLLIIFIYKCISFIICNRIYIRSEAVDWPSVNLPAELDFSLYLVAFCNSNVSHIVCKSAYSYLRALYNTDC